MRAAEFVSQLGGEDKCCCVPHAGGMSLWALWGGTCQLLTQGWGLGWGTSAQRGLHLQPPSAPSSGVLSDVLTAIHVIPAETLQCY